MSCDSCHKRRIAIRKALGFACGEKWTTFKGIELGQCTLKPGHEGKHKAHDGRLFEVRGEQ